MQKDTFPRAVPGIKGQLGHPGKLAAVAATANRHGPTRQPRATDARARRRDLSASQPAAPRLANGRLELAVIETQIDNIHQELDTHMHRAAQLETRMTGIDNKLDTLIELVKSLQDDVWSKAASVDGILGKVTFH